MENVVSQENMNKECKAVINRSFAFLRSKVGIHEYEAVKKEYDKLEGALHAWLSYVVPLIPETKAEREKNGLLKVAAIAAGVSGPPPDGPPPS